MNRDNRDNNNVNRDNNIIIVFFLIIFLIVGDRHFQKLFLRISKTVIRVKVFYEMNRFSVLFRERERERENHKLKA